MSALLVFLLTAQSPFTFAGNLVPGVGIANSIGSWANYSAVNVIPGSALLPSTSKSTVLYLAFTGGTTADIAKMVIYKTASRQTKILSVTPVTLGGVADPSIHLSVKTTCKTQPLSVTSPCSVRLDPLTLTLSPLNDYYFVIYFTNDSNNSALGGASTTLPSSLTGFYTPGDETQLKVGNPVPATSFTAPYFLVAVQTS